MYKEIHNYIAMLNAADLCYSVYNFLFVHMIMQISIMYEWSYDYVIRA